jgi:Flp pilus assembly protein TadD
VYIEKMLWPSGLGVFYPYPAGSLVWPAIWSGLGLTAITMAAIREAHRQPYFMVGWLWYLITLAPVIGLIQAGQQARADRYMYIPMVGLSIALVWGAAAVMGSRPKLATALGIGVCAVCGVLTWIQSGYWQDGIALFQHTVDVTGDNYIARFNLANALSARGETGEAAKQLEEAVRIKPDSAAARAELGQELAEQGRPEEALAQLRASALLKPGDANTHYRIGLLLGVAGHPDEAAVEFSYAIRLDPNHAGAHRNLGISLALMGKLPEAAVEFGVAVGLKPDDGDARFNFGVALANLGRTDEAIAQLSEALRINPASGPARAALDEVMASRNGSKK